MCARDQRRNSLRPCTADFQPRSPEYGRASSRSPQGTAAVPVWNTIPILSRIRWSQLADSLVSTRGFAGFDGSDIARGGPARPDLERRPLHGGGLDFGDSTAVYDLDTGALAATMVEVSTSSVTLLVDFSKVLEVA